MSIQRWQRTLKGGVIESCSIEQSRQHEPRPMVFGGEYGVEVVAMQSFHGGDFAAGDGVMGGFNTGKMITLIRPHRTQAEYGDRLAAFIDKLKRHGFKLAT